MGKTFSYDAFEDDDFESEDTNGSCRQSNDKHKRQVKKKLDDYLEQRQLRKNLGDDDFDF